METINKEYYFNDNFILKSDKSKIVLINTSNTIDNYLKKISFRYNKKYTKIPTFTIDREGLIYQHIDIITVSHILDNDSLNEQAIVIALENVGWLDFDPDLNTYYDWTGCKYNERITEISWRGKKYWAEYTNKQFLALTELIDYLCKTNHIKKEFIGNNVISGKIYSFEGIINRSNFSKNHYDLSPAFNFDNFNKYFIK